VSSSAAHGALLLAFYSAGLAIPFLLIALAFERMTSALGVVKRHFPVIIGVGGAIMIALGILIVTGEFTILNSWVSRNLPLGKLAGKHLARPVGAAWRWPRRDPWWSRP